MKVFISWSGTVSRKVAIIFKEWMPNVIQCIDAYVSSENIEKGTRWSTDIAIELADSNFGILCITKDNVKEPWVNFEAGALSKSLDEAKVCPFLYDLKTSALTNTPLLQFQATNYDKNDVLKLMKSINTSCENNCIPEDLLEKSFEKWWDSLKEKLDEICVDSTEIKEEAEILVDDNTPLMIEEILDLVRMQYKILKKPHEILPPEYLFEIIPNKTQNIDPKAVRSLKIRYDKLGTNINLLKKEFLFIPDEEKIDGIEEIMVNVSDNYKKLASPIKHIYTRFPKIK